MNKNLTQRFKHFLLIILCGSLLVLSEQALASNPTEALFQKKLTEKIYLERQVNDSVAVLQIARQAIPVVLSEMGYSGAVIERVAKGEIVIKVEPVEEQSVVTALPASLVFVDEAYMRNFRSSFSTLPDNEATRKDRIQAQTFIFAVDWEKQNGTPLNSLSKVELDALLLRFQDEAIKLLYPAPANPTPSDSNE